jgi:hypothetical protein
LDSQSNGGYLNSTYRLKPKWIGDSQTDTDEVITVPKKLYDGLLCKRFVIQSKTELSKNAYMIGALMVKNE